MRRLPIQKVMANQSIKCSLCEHVIEPGDICWHQSGGSNNSLSPICICTGHLPLNTKGMIIEPSTDGLPVTYIRADALDVRRDIIPKLLNDWDYIYKLTPEEFEELVFDRLIAMDLQPIRMGPANQKDGGIDIIFWTCDVFPMVGAVQIKHHRSPEAKTGPADVRGLVGGMQGQHFNVGVIVTNTSFTDDAKHRAEREASAIQLRDGRALRRWIADDFGVEGFNIITRTIELCRSIQINVPQFL